MNTPETEPAAPAPAPPPPAAEAPPSPGALLRQARERAGLGADDLAGQLKLAKGTLEALERDDFAALSEPVYVRGYYRKIAKVLPVTESELINAYNARTKPASAAPSLRRLPLAGGVAAGTSRHSQGPAAWLVIGAVVIVGVLVALWTREPPRRLAGAGAPAAVTPPPAAQEQEPPTAPAAAPAQDAAEPQAGAAPEPAPAAATPAGVPNQLVLEFSEASYVRVDDSKGRTLKIGLVRGGERHALDGAPPYTVFLGNAQNVRVYFAGTPVDFAAHVNPEINTARFTVP